MADVTKEVWCPAWSSTEGSTIPEEAFVVLVDRDVENHLTIFSVPNDNPPTDIELSRMTMAARAPTLYRLLEQVVQLGVAPTDLEEVIRINLHRAAPDVYPKPEESTRERRSAWQKLLADDQ